MSCSKSLSEKEMTLFADDVANPIYANRVQSDLRSYAY